MNLRNALVLGTVLLLAACGAATGSNEGRISLLLKDAPGDFKAAVVTIDQVYLQADGSGSDEGGRVVLRDDKVTTDLLTLAHDTADLVKDKAIPAGRYSELRFVVSGAYVEVENAQGGTDIYASSPDYAGLPAGAHVTGDLQMPSFGTSGLKVKLPGDGLDIEGEQVILLVDFDVQQSFGKQAGNSGKWVMHPVVEATDVEASGTAIVTLKAGQNVTLPAPDTLASFDAVLTTSAGTSQKLAFADADGDGTFEARFRFIAPGAYTIDLAGPAGLAFSTDPAHPQDLSIASGKESTTAFTLTAVSPAQQP